MNSTKAGSGANNDTPKFVARYIENFIDLVENVPNDLSRRISRVHELQLDYESSLSKLESNLTRFSRQNQTNNQQSTSTSNSKPSSSSNSNNNNIQNDLKQLKLLLTTQHCLIQMQDISDNKLAIIQDALDQLDTKSRELDHDFKLINAATSEAIEPQQQSNSNSKNTKNNINNKNAQSTSTNSGTQQPSKSSSHHHQSRESPEPTYCVCHQVSYGDMICCDNDACDIEWFHFQCVSLASKPKGKWYCPNCRGDRSNQPKK